MSIVDTLNVSSSDLSEEGPTCPGPSSRKPRTTNSSTMVLKEVAEGFTDLKEFEKKKFEEFKVCTFYSLSKTQSDTILNC